MMIGGYPYMVGNGAYFSYYPQYGNPYCFVMNGGYISGSLSVVPTAAHIADEPASVHRSGRSLAL